MKRALLICLLLVLSATSGVAAELTEQQKQELLQKFGDGKTWDPAKLKDATMKVSLPASKPFYKQQKNDVAEGADYPFVWYNSGKPQVSRSVDGFLNSGEKVKMGVAKIEKDSVRLWIGRSTANEAVNVRAFLVVAFNTYEQLLARIEEILTVQ